MFNFGKRLLTAMLSAAVILPALAVPTAVTAAENGADASVTYEEAEDTSGSSEDGHYSTDDVAGDLLVPHTGKSSELEYSPAEEVVSEASDDCFISLSSSSELYDSLGFNSAQMKQEMRDMAKDPAYQNPLSGYTFVDPNELLVGSVNRSENHGVLFETWDNESKSSAAELPNLEQLAKNTNDFTMNEDEDNQTHNGIGIDVDGDGIEELAYYSLYYNDDSNSGNIGSSCWIDILKRVPDGNSFKWQKVHSFHTYMQSGDYVLDIEAAESKGYVSLAAGDYDGDGKEELAYYMPDKKNSEDANDARVVVMNIDVNNGSYSHSELGSLHVKDFTSDYGHMGRGWRLPTVALSTTSTRLGNVKNASVGAMQYETHDDLVMTVSVPTEYRDDNLDLNSITKIFTFEGGGAQQLFRYEYLPFDNNTKRMNYPNTCDADLNGDGFKELVVAGMMEKEMDKPSGANDTNRNWGEFATDKNYVNIITHDGDGYKMVWGTPVEVSAPGNLSPGHYNSVEPTALCAGHFMYGTPGTKDQLCIQGVILDCSGAKVTGAPVRSGQNGDGKTVYIITDTKPYYDTDNFSGAHFDKIYAYDITSDSTVNASGDPWISQCVSGRFLDKTDVDQIAILSSDPVNANDDNLYMDISIISHSRTDANDADPEWTYKAYNDYLSKKNEDDDGTSLFLTFINSDEDSFYYRYAGTYTTYSAPVLYAVMQAPPYYREANTVTNNKFSITTGVSNYDKLNVGVGGSVSLQQSAEVGFDDFGLSLGIGTSFGADFAYNHTWTKQKTVTKSIYVKTDDDYAVCYAVPILVNNYEVVRTKDPNEEPEMVQITEPLEPMFVALTIDDYNAAVTNALANYTNDPEELSPDEDTPLIDKSELPPSSPGDPVAYAHSLDEAIGEETISKTDTSRGEAEADINSTIDRAETSISFTSSNDNSGSVTLKTSISFIAGVSVKVVPSIIPITAKGNVNLTLSGSIGYAGGRTNSNGVSFTTTYTGIPTALPGGVSFSDDAGNYSKLSATINGAVPVNSNIQHYSPGGSTYAYNSNEICYPLGDYEAEENMVFVHGFFTEPYAEAAEPPKEFGVKSVTKTNANGALDVELIWNSANRNPERKADGYNIYLLDKNPGELYLHLQNKEGPIFPGAGDFTEYTVHLAGNSYKDELTFYITPAYLEMNTGGTLIVTEGNLGGPAVIKSVSQATDGNILITKQPENQRIVRTESDETVTFEIEATKNKKSPVIGPVTFKWQRYDRAAEKWVDANEPETVAVSKNGIYQNTYSMTIPAAEKESFDSTGVRCLVSCGTYTVHSDIASVVLDDDPRPLATILYEGCDGAHLAFENYDNGALINNSSCHYSAGGTVKLSVDNDALFDKGVRIIGESSGDITNNVGLAYDRAKSEISFTMPDQYVSVSVPSVHNFDNGICVRCDQYEAPAKDSDGFYELKNAGNFLWFAALVNDEHDHADFDERDSGANAVMTADIDLENRIFNNIGKFSTSIYSGADDIYTGAFDGQGHTLNNFYTNGAYNRRGVFGNIKEADIGNLTVTGEIDATQFELDSYETLLGFVCMTNNSQIHDVTSCIDINSTSTAVKQMAGGIAAAANSSTGIKRCVNRGNITVNGNNSIAAGVIADVWSSAEVRDCTNFGAITCSGGSAAGMIALMEGDRNTISNCYNCGALTGSSDTNASAIALSPATKAEVTNCYYLDGTAPERVFTDNVTAKSADRFAAGEVGSLLNGSMSDGTQAWYQNIDNNASPDPYPLPDNSRGTIYRLGNTGYFSNSPDFLLGDVNLDGAVNIRDVTAIQRYTAEFRTLNNRQLAAADTDNDGGVTIADATLMQMYFAEFDVAWGS